MNKELLKDYAMKAATILILLMMILWPIAIFM